MHVYSVNKVIVWIITKGATNKGEKKRGGPFFWWAVAKKDEGWAKPQEDWKKKGPTSFFSPPYPLAKLLPPYNWLWVAWTIQSFYEYTCLVSDTFLLHQQFNSTCPQKMEKRADGRQYKCCCSVLRWRGRHWTTREKMKTRHPRQRNNLIIIFK